MTQSPYHHEALALHGAISMARLGEDTKRTYYSCVNYYTRFCDDRDLNPRAAESGQLWINHLAGRKLARSSLHQYLRAIQLAARRLGWAELNHVIVPRHVGDPGLNATEWKRYRTTFEGDSLKAQRDRAILHLWTVTREGAGALGSMTARRGLAEFGTSADVHSWATTLVRGGGSDGWPDRPLLPVLVHGRITAKPLTARGFSWVLRDHGRRAGIIPFNLHWLRRSSSPSSRDTAPGVPAGR